MKQLLCILLLLPFTLLAQEPLKITIKHHDTATYNWKGKVKKGVREGNWTGTDPKTGTKVKATFVKGQLNGPWTVHTKSGKLLEEGQYVNGLHDGRWTEYFYNGDTNEICHYKMDVPDGRYASFLFRNRMTVDGNFVNGKKEGKWIKNSYNYRSEYMARTEYTYVNDVLSGTTTVTTYSGVKTFKYDAGSLVSRDSVAVIDTSFTNKPWPPLKDEPLAFAEEMPHFAGGEAAFQVYISQNIQYPTIARAEGKEGTVYISFVIEADGSITEVIVRKGVPNAPELDAEALRVIESMPNWVPGKMNGKPVAVEMTIPVKFTLR